MSADYAVLAVIAVLGIGGGMLLLFQAKNYRSRHHGENKHLPNGPAD